MLLAPVVCAGLCALCVPCALVGFLGSAQRFEVAGLPVVAQGDALMIWDFLKTFSREGRPLRAPGMCALAVLQPGHNVLSFEGWCTLCCLFDGHLPVCALLGLSCGLRVLWCAGAPSPRSTGAIALDRVACGEAVIQLNADVLDATRALLAAEAASAPATAVAAPAAQDASGGAGGAEVLPGAAGGAGGAGGAGAEAGAGGDPTTLPLDFLSAQLPSLLAAMSGGSWRAHRYLTMVHVALLKELLRDSGEYPLPLPGGKCVGCAPPPPSRPGFALCALSVPFAPLRNRWSNALLPHALLGPCDVPVACCAVVIPAFGVGGLRECGALEWVVTSVAMSRSWLSFVGLVHRVVVLTRRMRLVVSFSRKPLVSLASCDAILCFPGNAAPSDTDDPVFMRKKVRKLCCFSSPAPLSRQRPPSGYRLPPCCADGCRTLAAELSVLVCCRVGWLARLPAHRHSSVHATPRCPR
jgi:hypothetical protein